MGLTLTTAPTVYPVTLAEAKAYLRVDSDDENALIRSLIAAGTTMAEAYAVRQFITGTYTLKCDDFPDLFGPIVLPRTPFQSLTSIQYVGTGGTVTTLSTDYYETNSDDVSAKVVLKPNQEWPEVQSEKYEAVTVTYVAGYGDTPADVPETARTAVLLLVGHLYENREAVVIGKISSTLPIGVRALLDTVSVRGPV